MSRASVTPASTPASISTVWQSTPARIRLHRCARCRSRRDRPDVRGRGSHGDRRGCRELLLTIGNQTVQQHAPVVYQEYSGERQTVTGRYVLRENGHVGFDIGGYDRSQTLVIDPVLDTPRTSAALVLTTALESSRTLPGTSTLPARRAVVSPSFDLAVYQRPGRFHREVRAVRESDLFRLHRWHIR